MLLISEIFLNRDKDQLKCSRLKELIEGDLDDYPITTKKPPDKHGPEILEFIQNPTNVGKLYKNRYVVATTSGTSGQIGIIINTLEEFYTTQIIGSCRILGDYIRNWISDCRFISEKLRMVFIIAEGHYMTSLMAQIVPPFSGLFLDTQIISIETPIYDIVDILNNYQPHIIHSYPSVLEQIITEDELSIKPDIILTGSEPLSLPIRTKIEITFLTARVIETYGCSECPFIASSCDHNVLHLYDDLCIIELIDNKNNILPFEKGTISDRILLTNLLNHTEPIIRYLLDDSIEVIECECGSDDTPIRVHGRSDDIINLIDIYGNKKRILPLSLESSIFLKVPLVQYQLVHTHQNHLHIYFISHNNNTYNLLTGLIDTYLNERDLTKVRYTLERRHTIERDTSKKFKQIVSLV